jgi:hypothetical protein
VNQDKVVDEIFPSCSAIVKTYGEEFGFSRDVLFRLRKKQHKTDYSCYAKGKYKNINFVDILFGETPKDCEKIMERKQNLEKMQPRRHYVSTD